MIGKTSIFEDMLSFPLILICNKECLKYKALNMTFERGPILSQKYNTLQTRSQKLPKWLWKYMIWKEKDLNVRIPFFPCDNVLRQTGEIFLISIILAINHCVAFYFSLRFTWRCVHVGKTELFECVMLTWLLNSPFFKTLRISLNSSLNLIFMKKKIVKVGLWLLYT